MTFRSAILSAVALFALTDSSLLAEDVVEKAVDAADGEEKSKKGKEDSAKETPVSSGGGVQVYVNDMCGHLLRTKSSSVNEGSIMWGFSGLDSILLVEGQ